MRSKLLLHLWVLWAAGGVVVLGYAALMVEGLLYRAATLAAFTVFVHILVAAYKDLR